ncbi:MAG TPA: RidA family protein [Trichormus sp.]|jgi:2-iminobutanoate/2-iminopropanoate deaminase
MQPSSELATIGHITSPNLTKPLPIYSHATIHNGMVYTSAIQGFIPGSFDFPSLDPKVQAQQVLDNLKKLLDEVGSGTDRIVKMTIYMTQSKYFPGINEAVNEVFPESPPARSSITVADLPHDAEVAIEVIATLK